MATLPPTEVRTDRSVEAFTRAITNHLTYTRGAAVQSASPHDIYFSFCHAVRDHLMDRWRRTVNAYYEANPKFVYYLSAEYLLGRQLPNNLLAADLEEIAREALASIDIDYDEMIALDMEPGLGNGGLGRLAACFIDSLATLDIPFIGYGIRYEYGIFRQSFRHGWQVESPDEWLINGNPWEFPQPDNRVEVMFGGRTESFVDADGDIAFRWIPGERVLGEPYHTLVPGYDTSTVGMLRLWGARATQEFDFQLFDSGDYARAVETKTASENITKVLYPNDTTPQGQELRLRQQYFFVACSLQDIIRRFQLRNSQWREFPEQVAIQLNDTHPVIAIPELMRLLMDQYNMSWDSAWDITQRTFAYTCHTLMPEALERWPVELFTRLLPRHLEIIYEINHRFMAEVRFAFPGDEERLARMSIIEEGDERQVRMANLATIGSFSINGVAELQSKLLREHTLRDFAELWPARFNNKTNGVTPRRFMRIANPRLSALISERLGDGWLTDLTQLSGLEAYIDDPAFRTAWYEAKQANKQELADLIRQTTGVVVDVNSMFDIMVKRLHEYKRQLLNALHIVTLYNRIKANPNSEFTPRTIIFGAKAAPGYHMAKLIIKLINSIADVVNNDVDVRGRLKVVFVPNFNVTTAQKIYPAGDLSEQISMAGKEASGTGNMKFALNGAITIGTLDGANIEIRERVGAENFFLFGQTADEVMATKAAGYNPMDYYLGNVELKHAIDRIASGAFSGGNLLLFQPIVDSLLHDDQFLHLADYQSYIETQDAVALAYQEQDAWTRMSILNAARCGFFTSDRSMQQYCEDIWDVEAVPVPAA